MLGGNSLLCSNIKKTFSLGKLRLGCITVYRIGYVKCYCLTKFHKEFLVYVSEYLDKGFCLTFQSNIFIHKRGLQCVSYASKFNNKKFNSTNRIPQVR